MICQRGCDGLSGYQNRSGGRIGLRPLMLALPMFFASLLRLRISFATLIRFPRGAFGAFGRDMRRPPSAHGLDGWDGALVLLPG